MIVDSQDIHSKMEREPLSEIDGKQYIIDFQSMVVYSADLLSIHQCKIILFFDFFCISLISFISGQSPQM
jgi:hypothetical protein